MQSSTPYSNKLPICKVCPPIQNNRCNFGVTIQIILTQYSDIAPPVKKKACKFHCRIRNNPSDFEAQVQKLSSNMCCHSAKNFQGWGKVLCWHPDKNFQAICQALSRIPPPDIWGDFGGCRQKNVQAILGHRRQKFPGKSCIKPPIFFSILHAKFFKAPIKLFFFWKFQAIKVFDARLCGDKYNGQKSVFFNAQACNTCKMQCPLDALTLQL